MMQWVENLPEETAAPSGWGLLSGPKTFAFKALQGAKNWGVSCGEAMRRAGCKDVSAAGCLLHHPTQGEAFRANPLLWVQIFPGADEEPASPQKPRASGHTW